MRILQIFKKFSLIVFTLGIFINSNCISAQSQISPEAASFEPVDATDMVNLLTGDLTYVLPLLNVPSPEGGYPLSLSYHAGVAFGQEASWVGLGWNVNPGVINRNVNGEPDDWYNGKQLNFLYSDLGEQDVVTIGVGAMFKIYNVGVDYTFINGKGSGGTISFGMSIGGKGGAKVGTSIGYGGNKSGVASSASVNNISVGMSSKGTKVSYYGMSYHTKDGFSFSGSGGALGVSLDSNGFGYSLGNFGVNLINSNQVTENDATIRSTGFGIMIPIKMFYLKFSYFKSTGHIFDSENNKIYGSLYSRFGSLANEEYYLQPGYTAASNRYMDTTGSFMSGIHPTEGEYYYANPQFLNYDDYFVSGQGISAKIQPYVYNYGTLVGNTAMSRYSGIYLHDDNPFVKIFGSTSSNIYFYNSINQGSFLKVNNTPWNIPSTLNEVTDITSTEILETNLLGENGYNSSSKRRKSGVFVESYTNNQIISNPSLINEATNFNRVGSKGIGAFKVTTLDGKTYHYSLPVYEYENVVKGYDNIIGEESRFYEIQRVTPHATHWLLTAITGPDYVDNNTNGVIDSVDYGYWVTFDYGKWTDSYMWDREVKSDKRIRGRVNRFDAEKEEVVKSWGVKQLYYLNAINTRTHSALFMKSVRADNVGSSFSKSWTYDDVDKNVVLDDIQLAAGVYFTQLDYAYIANITESTSLKLDKIILVENEDINNFNLSHSITPDINQAVNTIRLRASGYKWNSAGSLIGETNETLHDREWTAGNYQSNVYLTNNYSQSLIDQHAVSSINFNHSYSLYRKNSSSIGKLTLNKLETIGRNNTNLIPPYAFTYYNSSTYNDDDDFDLWGFYKGNPENWSLKDIKTPTGSKLTINYEPDDFKTILLEENSLSNSRMTPVPRSFERLNNGYKGEFSLIYTNPCYEISEIYSCLTPNSIIEVVFTKSGYPTQTIEAQITSISNETMLVNFLSQVPSHFTGNFYITNHRNGTNKYIADLRIEDCFTDQAIGKCNDSRGGIRVSEIINYSDGIQIKTKYDYTNFENNESSGITSHTPYLTFPQLSGLIPGPGVMYKNVTVKNTTADDEVYAKSTYEFNTLEPLAHEIGAYLSHTGQPGQSSSGTYVIDQIGDYLKVDYQKTVLNTDIVNNYYDEDVIRLMDIKITNNYSLLGTLKSTNNYNSENQLTNRQTYDYGDNPFEDKLGTNSESFKAYQSSGTYISPFENDFTPSRADFSLTKTTLKKNNSFVSKTESVNASFKNVVSYNKYDFLTGQVLETVSEDSKGNRFKTEIIPAYTIAEYSGELDLDNNNEPDGYGMDSKVDNPTNKNMLTQQAMTKTYLDVNGEWKETGIGITGWNNKWIYTDVSGSKEVPTNAAEKIWRKHKSYVWDGGLNANGTLQGFTNPNPNEDDEYFNWNLGGFVSDMNGNTFFNEPAQSNPKWKNTLTTTLYDHFSIPLESKDINDNYASTKMCDDGSKKMAVCNAKYTEMFYSGAEYFSDNNAYFDGQVKSGHRQTNAHTGKYSIYLNSGSKGFEVNLKSGEHRSGEYKVSVWVNKGGEGEARLKVGGTTYSFNDDGFEQIPSGNWVMLNKIVDIPASTTTVYVTSASGNSIYFDDFRLHPIVSSMTSYVYNEWDELSYILDSNNLGTHFKYDEAGRLEETYNEIIDDEENNITGGFKRASKNYYRYKNQ